MIKYNQGMPMYWRNETSGRLHKAVMAFLSPACDLSLCEKSPENIPELSDEDVCLLREYLVHWAEAPCFQNNPHISRQQKLQLEGVIMQAKDINNRADINNVLDALMKLVIDPF